MSDAKDNDDDDDDDERTGAAALRRRCGTSVGPTHGTDERLVRVREGAERPHPDAIEIVGGGESANADGSRPAVDAAAAAAVAAAATTAEAARRQMSARADRRRRQRGEDMMLRLAFISIVR